MDCDTGSKRRFLGRTRARAIDRISDFPDELIQNILSFLKVDESVPTSILSKRWRYQWTFNPNLHFTDSCNLKAIHACINQNQSTQLHGFHLNHRYFHLDYGCIYKDYVSGIEELIDFVIHSKIRNVTLKPSHIFSRSSLRSVPFSLFSSHTLESLKLGFDSCCVVELPTDINCFETLVNLSLSFVQINREFLSIISKFRRLQTLDLYKVTEELFEISISLPELRKLSLVLEDRHALKIHVPNLQDLYVNGDYIEHCNVEKAPYLRKVRLFCGNLNAVESLIQNISTVEILRTKNSYLKQYIEDNRSKGPRLALKNLRKISLIQCNSYQHLACFFQDCPLLEEINLDALAKPRDECESWEESLKDEDAKLSSEFVDKSLDRLKVVNIKNFSGDPDETALIKLLLREAAILQTVRLSIHLKRFTQGYVDWLTKRVTMFPKISASAIIEHHRYDYCDIE